MLDAVARHKIERVPAREDVADQFGEASSHMPLTRSDLDARISGLSGTLVLRNQCIEDPLRDDPQQFVSGSFSRYPSGVKSALDIFVMTRGYAGTMAAEANFDKREPVRERDGQTHFVCEVGTPRRSGQGYASGVSFKLDTANQAIANLFHDEVSYHLMNRDWKVDVDELNLLARRICNALEKKTENPADSLTEIAGRPSSIEFDFAPQRSFFVEVVPMAGSRDGGFEAFAGRAPEAYAIRIGQSDTAMAEYTEYVISNLDLVKSSKPGKRIEEKAPYSAEQFALIIGLLRDGAVKNCIEEIMFVQANRKPDELTLPHFELAERIERSANELGLKVSTPKTGKGNAALLRDELVNS